MGGTVIGALGAVVGSRDRSIRVLVVFVTIYFASVVAFFLFSRYRICVVPALAVLGSIGICWAGTRVRRRAWRSWPPAHCSPPRSQSPLERRHHRSHPRSGVSSTMRGFSFQ